MNRQEVIRKCGSLVIACWNRYSDHNMSKDKENWVRSALQRELPIHLRCTKYNKEERKLKK